MSNIINAMLLFVITVTFLAVNGELDRRPWLGRWIPVDQLLSPMKFSKNGTNYEFTPQENRNFTLVFRLDEVSNVVLQKISNGTLNPLGGVHVTASEEGSRLHIKSTGSILPHSPVKVIGNEQNTVEVIGDELVIHMTRNDSRGDSRQTTERYTRDKTFNIPQV